MSPTWRRYLRFLRPDVDADVDDELRFHFDARMAELARQGMTKDAARAKALEEFGDVEQTRAGLRDIDRRMEKAQRRGEWWGSLAQDVRYAARSLVQAPGFSLAAILTIALGVGVNSVIFSAVHAVLLRPLPYDDASRLVWIREISGNHGQQEITVAPANFVDYQRDNRVFTGMAGYDINPMNLTGDGAPRRVWVNGVSASFFEVLRQPLALGRNFRASENTPGNERVTILSHELWRDLGADTAMVGRGIRLSDHEYQVIGVLRPGFQAPDQFGFSQPIGLYIPAAYPPELLGPQGRGDHEIDVIARLRDGVTLDQARADMNRLTAQIAAAFPETSAKMAATVRPLHDAVVGPVRQSLLVLLGAVALVWLVACVNLANLLLVRAVGRQREVTMRVALGASRSRIVQSLLAHSVLISLLGCAAGLGLGALLRGLLVSVAPENLPRLDSIAMSGPVFAVTALLSLAAGIVFGLFPAWHVARVQPAQSLRAGDHGLAGRSVLRWQRALVVTEVALSFILLIGSGLMLRSFVTLMGVDLGFETRNVLAANVTLPESRYPRPEDRLRFFETLEERLTTIPGVEGVTYTNRLPMRGGWSSGVQIDPAGADTTGVPVEADMQAVSPGYFATLGLTALRGRLLERTDREGAQPVVVVNAEFARRFFRAADPVGGRLKRGGRWLTIVGVVSDVRRGGKAEVIEPGVYIPAAQYGSYPVRLSDLAVRTTGNPYDIVPQVRSAVLAIDADQPIANVNTLDDVIAQRVAPRRFEAMLLVLFAAVALALAVVGIYGVVSYSVSQRTPEFGIRVALGAKGGDIVRMVLRQAGVLVVIGLAVGFAGAAMLTRFLTTLLFEITPSDPLTFGAVAALLAAVAIVACWLPARRAGTADPMTALRSE
jgi:putative ABC transport system permease protein